jgi:membrane peptidoglycan carboxypeptidase
MTTNLWELPPKLGRAGLRSVLLKVHADLFIVHRKVLPGAKYYPPELTELERMVLVLEDRRFMRHLGIDIRSILREVSRALTFRRYGGASTIDMQFIRTATGYRNKTLWRKLYEMLLALLIQFRYSKITILRSYLSCAYFGSGLIGASRASRRIFGVGDQDLNLEQAAFLAAMLVYPRPLKAVASWESKVRRRANYGVRVYVADKKSFDQLPV